LELKGQLAKDKQSFLSKIDQALSYPDLLKPEYFRGL
jgi:hypothetical protein